MSISVAADRPSLTGARTTPSAPVLLLEFNELSPTLIERFIAAGELPNFKRLRDTSQVFVTDAEEAAPNLEPWIQWVTVHTGLSFDEHGIFHLGDGHKLEAKCLWDLVSDAGRTVWVCGSMNVRYDLPINGAIVPDPWATGCQPYPSELLPYYVFVQRNVQEYTNDRVPLSRSDYIAFLKFMVTHGLSLRTARAIVRQLVSERLTGQYRWKRATILDKLQWDVFRWYHRKLRPHFATFFLNSTAHFQHMHWRNMDPTPFTVKPTDEEQAEFQDAILYGYREMDRVVGDALSLAGADGVVVLSSALGQQPCLKYEDIGGKTFYRPRVFEKLLEFAGAPGNYTVAPVMSEQFHIMYGSEAEAERGFDRLDALRVDGKRALMVERRGSALFAGCCIYEQLSHEAMLTGGGKDGTTSLPFFRIFYHVEGTKSGMHHPDGILWMRVPGMKAATHPDKVPLLAVPPTLLQICGLTKPAYMKEESLLAPATVTV